VIYLWIKPGLATNSALISRLALPLAITAERVICRPDLRAGVCVPASTLAPSVAMMACLAKLAMGEFGASDQRGYQCSTLDATKERRYGCLFCRSLA